MPNNRDTETLREQNKVRRETERETSGRSARATAIVGRQGSSARVAAGFGSLDTALDASALSISDRPITNPSQDTLSRSKFAELVARSILQQSELDSLVIGLVGAWGSGKTSLLNLIQFNLLRGARKTQSDENVPVVVRFNPWLFADQNQLSRRFFYEISAVLQRDADAASRRTGRRIDEAKMMRLAELIDGYAGIIQPFKLFGPPGEAVVSSARSLADLLGKRTKRVTDDLQTFKERINDALRSLNRRIVVMVDDIDRLSATEIVQVFQLARLMGDFTKTTYILAFDRRMVANVLQSVQQNKGYEYLEKIVQISLDVPAISRADIRKAAQAEIGKVVGLSASDNQAVIRRYAKLFDFAAQYFLKTPRNVAKLATTYHFHRVLLSEDGDVIDLLGATMLQVFAPDLYETLRDRPELFLIDNKRQAIANEAAAASYKQGLDALLSGAGVEAPLSELESFLGVMFPRVLAALENRPLTEQEITDVETRRGIGHERFAQEYFDFTLPEREYSERHWDVLRRKLEGNDERIAIMDAADILQNQMSRVDPMSFLDRVRRFQGSITQTEKDRILAKRLARLLLVEGDELVARLEESHQRTLLECRMVELIEALLMEYGDENVRHSVLQAIFNYGHSDHVSLRGVGIPVLFLQRLRAERGKKTALYRERFGQMVDLHIIGGDDAFEDVESHAETLIERSLKKDGLVNTHYLIDVLAALCDMDHRRSAVKYLNELLSSGNDFVLVAVAELEERLRDERDATWELLKALKGTPPDGVVFSSIATRGRQDSRIERARVEMMRLLV